MFTASLRKSAFSWNLKNSQNDFCFRFSFQITTTSLILRRVCFVYNKKHSINKKICKMTLTLLANLTHKRPWWGRGGGGGHALLVSISKYLGSLIQKASRLHGSLLSLSAFPPLSSAEASVSKHQWKKKERSGNARERKRERGERWEEGKGGSVSLAL